MVYLTSVRETVFAHLVFYGHPIYIESLRTFLEIGLVAVINSLNA